MKGWFCIYECSENKWLMDGVWWQPDYATITLPTKIELNEHWLTDNNGEYKKDYMLYRNEYRNLLLKGDGKTNPHSIMKFETIGEAENYILNSGLNVSNGEFYSIRKIYF